MNCLKHFMKKMTVVVVSLSLLFAMVPGARTAAATKKPKIATRTTVRVGGKKALPIKKNGYKIKKIVSVKVKDKSIAKAEATKSKVTVYGLSGGSTKVTIKVKVKKGKKTSIFSLTTRVVVDSVVDELLGRMSLDGKISQMIMPSMRQWDGTNMRDLSAAPRLAGVLRRHQYGGVILFGANISDAEQTTRLVSALQMNNARSDDAAKMGVIPYMISADEEGGAVARLSMGTRGTGSMAIGATGANAVKNAKSIGKVFGEELDALGINVNLAPCIDVIKDLSDLGMSTRVYSDDAATNAKLGSAFSSGLGVSDVITTYKHFPGAGDGSDYPTSIGLTYDELSASGLAAYKQVIDDGAEMLMMSATTFPKIDDQQVMADGVTKGYYPATCSHKIVTDILRKELGFDGVVITDALEMDQFIVEPDLLSEVRAENPNLSYKDAVELTESKAKLFSGTPRSVENGIQAAKYAINAGCDILLLPTDLIDEDAVNYYDNYIAGIASLVGSGEIDQKNIDASVRRILTLKERRGILDIYLSESEIEDKVSNAKAVVGSAEHHAVEAETAKQAVTLLKNDNVIPVSGAGKKIVIIGRTTNDSTPVMYAINQLKESGKIDADARIENHITDVTMGDGNSETSIVIDYYTSKSGVLDFPERISEEIKDADVVIAISSVSAGDEPLVQLQDDYYVMKGTSRIISEAHAVGTKAVLLSANIPMDTARFQDADAIICAYLAAGFNVDPTARMAGSENVAAFNANVPAAIVALFGSAKDITGQLPINIPQIQKNGDRWEFTSDILFARGYSANSVKTQSRRGS